MAPFKDEPFPATPSPKRRSSNTEKTQPREVMSAGGRLLSDSSLYGQSFGSQRGPLPQSVPVATTQRHPRQTSTPTRRRSLPGVQNAAPIGICRDWTVQGAAITHPTPSRTLFGNRAVQSKQGVQKSLVDSAHSGETPVFFKDPATQRKVNKRKNQERPPNPKDLELFDPSTSKRPKTSLSLTEPDPVDTVGSKDLSVGKQHTKCHEKAQGSQRVAGEQMAIIEITHQNESTRRTSTPDKEKMPAKDTQRDTLLYGSACCTKAYPTKGCIDGFGMNCCLKVGVQDVRWYIVRLHIYEPLLQQLLATIQVPGQIFCFEFTKTCLATKYQQRFPLEDRDFVGWGHIDPKPECHDQLSLLAAEFAANGSGAAYSAKTFNMLVYPAGSEEWGFLDRRLPTVPEGTMLRFVVREPLSVKPKTRIDHARDTRP